MFAIASTLSPCARAQDAYHHDIDGARVGYYWNTNCAGGPNSYFRNPMPFEVIEVHTGFDDYSHPGDVNRLVDEAFVLKLLDHIKNESRNYCQNRSRNSNARILPNNYHILFGDINNLQIEAIQREGQQWTVTNFYRNNLLAQQAAQQAAQNARLRVDEAKRQITSSFLSQNGVEIFATDVSITANPFVYKGKITGFRTNFTQMLSETEAVFSLDREILVTNVPPTRFRGGEAVVLAVRIIGTKAIKVMTGEIVIPYGEYVGVYQCTQGCTEFFAQGDRPQ